MTRFRRAQPSIPNEQPLSIIRRDISAGINNRQHGTNIQENQVELLQNVDNAIAGIANKRKGTNLIEKLGTDEGEAAFGWNPVGGTPEVLVIQGTKLEGYTGSGTFTEHDTGFTDGLKTTMVKCIKNDGTSLLIISNGTDNVHEMAPDHTVTDLGSAGTDPVKTRAMTFYRNRLWTLKNEQLDYSDAAPSSYNGSFNNAAFFIPVGNEVALLGTKDAGLYIIGDEATYTLNPSMTPAAADKPEKLFSISAIGTDTFVNIGDDIIGLYRDGVRAVRRTAEDKLQLGTSFPLSYVLKDEVESVNWNAAHKATAVWYDNQYLLSLPVDGSSTNNEVWVFYPASNSWSVFTGLNVGGWAKINFDGKEELFYIDSTDGGVYQMFQNDTDEDNTGASVNIEYIEAGRKEDLGDQFRRKNGGEITIRALATGDSNLTVKAQFDEGGYSTLGTLNLSGNLLTFPLTFPVTFKDANVMYKKFHLDDKGSWYTIQLKLEHSGADDAQILERTIVAFPEEYISEEDNE